MPLQYLCPSIPTPSSTLTNCVLEDALPEYALTQHQLSPLLDLEGRSMKYEKGASCAQMCLP